MHSHATDDEGNLVCSDCMAHVPPHLVAVHVCPGWLKELVKNKRRDERYMGNLIANSSPNIPIEYREQDMRDEL